jgi:hypothetical protein
MFRPQHHLILHLEISTTFLLLPRLTNLNPPMSPNNNNSSSSSSSRLQPQPLPSNLKPHSNPKHHQHLLPKLETKLLHLLQPAVQTLCTVQPLLWRQSNVPWATCVSTVVEPIQRRRIHQIEVADEEVHVVADEETKLSTSMYQRQTLTLRAAMPNLTKPLPYQKMTVFTVTRMGKAVKETKIKLVRLIINQLLSLILSRLRLTLPHLVVLVVDIMVEVEEDEVEVEGT